MCNGEWSDLLVLHTFTGGEFNCLVTFAYVNIFLQLIVLASIVFRTILQESHYHLLSSIVQDVSKYKI